MVFDLWMLVYFFPVDLNVPILTWIIGKDLFMNCWVLPVSAIYRYIFAFDIVAGPVTGLIILEISRNRTRGTQPLIWYKVIPFSLFFFTI